MDENQRELTFEESVQQVMQTLPPVIRTYLAQGKYTDVAKALINKYRLRVDQGGILEREIMLLLMGIEDPDEFTQALSEEIKLDQQTVNRIVQDVNTEIFIPLREQMRGGGENKVEQKPIEKPALPVMRVLPPRASAIPSNPQMPSRQPQAPVPRYVPPPPPPPPRPRPVTPPVPKPVNATLLSDHEEPHIEFKDSAPRAAPPPNLPGAMPPPPPSPPIPPPAPKPVPPPPVKSYSTDPYREPIE